MSQITLAVDAMGGDFGPSITVPASLQSLDSNNNLAICLVGDERQLAPYLSGVTDSNRKRISILHTHDVITMADKPSVALKSRPNASMRLAIEMVKSGDADACVSGGNTGAMMALGRFLLKTYPGIDRPAIISAMPTQRGHCYVLDLGANVDSNSHHLHQFAVMGATMVSSVENISRPRVGLLNIGEEEIKGNEQVKMAAELIRATDYLNYVGFVEGDDLFKGVADLVVCDGFVGNVLLKTTEGIAEMIEHIIRGLQQQSPGFSRFFISSFVNRLNSEIDPKRYNGATFLGLQGILVKSHGDADQRGFERALVTAIREVELNVPNKINKKIEELMV